MAVNQPVGNNEATLIDVRSPDEFLKEHIPGSKNIPLETLILEAPNLANQPVVLTCQSGRRAAEGKRLLEAYGCQSVSLLEGGLQGWKAQGRQTRSFKRGLSVMQQVQIIAGSMVLIGSFIKPLKFFAWLAGFGLLTAGLTNTCLMATILSRMPWNKATEGNQCALNNKE